MNKPQQLPTFSIFIIFLSLTIIGFGLSPLLPLRYMPSSQAPSIHINYSWQGAAPLTLEQEITTPLEGAFNMIQGVEEISSVSQNGQGSISLGLDPNGNIDMIRFEVAAAIRRIYPALPEKASYPVISRSDPNDQQRERPILSYSLSGPGTGSDIYRFANTRLKPRLALLPNLANIQVSGANELEYRIIYDPTTARQLGISESDIQQAIQRHYSSTPLGMARQQGGNRSITLRNSNNIQQSELRGILLGKRAGQLIRLGELAEIKLTEAPPQRHFRINGKNSVRISFFAAESGNQIKVARQVRESMERELPLLSQKHTAILEQDNTEYLSKELDKIKKRSLFSLAILLSFVLISSRDWRRIPIIVASLSANLGIAVLFYHLFDVQLHLYALAGITVSFGIMIDNSIVMIHHYSKRRDSKVFAALCAATLTTISALVVVAFLPERWQADLLDFAKVIAINLGVSLVVSLWLIPALMEALVFKKTNNQSFTKKIKHQRRIVRLLRTYKGLLGVLLRFKGLAIAGVILLFGLPTFLIPTKVEGWDRYNKIMSGEAYLEHGKPIVDKVFGGTLRLFVNEVYEGAGYRQPQETVLHIRASMPNGSTLEQMDLLIKKMEDFLENYPQRIKRFSTSVWSGQQARMEITFHPRAGGAFPYQLRAEAIRRSLNLGGAEWNISGVGEGFSNDKNAQMTNYRLAMKGYHYEGLEEQAEAFASKLKEHPRVKKVDTESNMNWWTKDLHSYEMAPNIKRLAALNIPTNALAQAVEPYDQGTRGQIRLPDGSPLQIMPNDLATRDLWALNHKPQWIDSTTIVIGRLADLEKKKISADIHKKNQEYIRIITWDYSGSSKFGNQHLAACMEQARKEMPLGYSMEQQAVFNWGGAGGTHQYALLLLVVGLIFFVCAILFESLRQAVSIILLIPTSFIGIFITFYGFDLSFDQGGYTSFILCSGLVVNSLILIINDYNHFRKINPKKSDMDNYLRAFAQKINPISITLFSTAMGLLPFIMAGESEVFWFPLAAGTIGGLCFSLPVIICFAPLFLRIKQDKL